MEIESQPQTIVTDDEKLRQMLRCVTVPCVPPGLDARVTNSYIEAMVLQAKAKETNLDLRRKVTLSLVRVFAGSVCLTGLVILLIGFGWIKLPPEIVHVLLAATISQAVVLYKAVITNIFPCEDQTKAPHVAD